MEWYCALTGHLLKKNNTVVGEESFEPIQKVLEDRVVAFYKALLLYQMKSVCSYYRNQSVVFLRGLVDLDKWNGDLQSVTNAEDTLLKDWNQYDKAKAEELLTEHVKLTEKIETKLGDIHQTLEGFIDQQKEMRIDTENRKYLDDLFVVDPQHDMTTIESKKDKLLDAAYNWILGTPAYKAFTNWNPEESALPPYRLLWIKGHAGTGKTMLLIGIIRELSKQLALLAPHISHFFCQGTVKTRNSATAILRSLMWMLLLQQPHLITGLREKFKVPLPKLFEDESAFSTLSDAFESTLEDLRSPVYFIVDALDECDRANQGLGKLIKLISTSLTRSDKVRWLVSSRPMVDVLAKLNIADISGIVDLDAQSLDGPVDAYINHKLSTLEGRDGYDPDTLRAVSDEIYGRAEKTFLWVALVFKALDEEDEDLNPVHGSYAPEIVKEIPPGLSDLYDHMMTRIEKGKRRDPQYCKNVLLAATLAYRPLSLRELAVLAGLRPKSDPEPQTIVNQCGSFLATNEETVSLIHQSAKDYLDKNHKSRLQPGGIAQGHTDITRRSIDAMSTLKIDIYDLRQYGFQSKDITPPEEDPLARIRYSCVFWLNHLRDAIKENPENNKLCNLGFDFLKVHLLHWLESLSLLHKLSDGIISVRELLNVVQVCL
jgi:hypothetical protein